MTGGREPLELVAMLTTRTPDMIASGRGGKGALTWTDVASALAYGRCREGPETLLYAKYARDYSALWRCLELWDVEVRHIAHRDDWRTRHTRRIEYLAAATLDDHVSGSLCPACSGARITPEQQECPVCLGTGNRHRSGRWWSDALDIHRSRLAPWEPRIRACAIRLQEWEMQAGMALSAGLGMRG